MNAYWMNSYYAMKMASRLYGCAAPLAQSIALPGFEAGNDYYISYFSTRMDTVRPMDEMDTTQTGTVTLDLTSAPLSGQVGTPLDTLHSDYAFIIATGGHVRSMMGTSEQNTTPEPMGWDFAMYPNPASDEIFLQFIDNDSRTIEVLDLWGRHVGSWARSGKLVHLTSTHLARGVYWVRASDGLGTKTKRLIVR